VALRRQRQMCIRDSHSATRIKNIGFKIQFLK
jgi:hypothetical protein